MSSAWRCAPSSRSNRARCCRCIRASRSLPRSSPISTRNGACPPSARRARWKTTRASPPRASRICRAPWTIRSAVAGAAGAEEVHLRELERAAKLLKEQLETEFDEISGGAGARASKGDARRRAHHPARPGAQIPSFPKKLPITLFATLGTLIFSVGAIISGELLSGKARPAAPAPSGPEAEAKAPAAAASAPPGAEQTSEDAELTRAAEAEEAEDAGASKSAEPLAETQTAPSQVDPPRREAACVKVLVALCGADASSDEAAIALGRNLARRGRALLIAADSGAEGFEAFAPEQESEPKGLADLLTVETAFADAIHRDASSRLHVMTPASARAKNATTSNPSSTLWRTHTTFWCSPPHANRRCACAARRHGLRHWRRRSRGAARRTRERRNRRLFARRRRQRRRSRRRRMI